jgi:hypothetical protein
MKTETETELELPFHRPPKGWDPKVEAARFNGKRFGPTPSQTPSSKKESEDTIPNTTDK